MKERIIVDLNQGYKITAYPFDSGIVSPTFAYSFFFNKHYVETYSLALESIALRLTFSDTDLQDVN